MPSSNQTVTATNTKPTVYDQRTAELAVRQSVNAKTATVVDEITALTITDRTTYGDADLLLGRIRQAKRQATEIFEEKLGGILKRTYDNLQELYVLRKELTETPFANAEAAVKSKMSEWQEQDRRRIEQERQAALAEERRQQAEADRLKRVADQAAASARSASAKRHAEEQAEQARQKQEAADRAREAAIQAEAAKPVTGSFSRTTVKKVPMVTDLGAFLDAIHAGTIPIILVQVNEEVMKEYWKQDRGLVSAWPGVEIVDQTTVGGR